MPRTEYLLPEELPLFYDSRRVLELINDLGTGAATLSDLGTLGTPENLLVQSVILSVSAEIDSALQVGNMYARNDIEQIMRLTETETDPELLRIALKRAHLVKQLTADLVFGRLLSRRGYTSAAMVEVAPNYPEALKKINELASGRRIFDLEATRLAGVPSTAPIGISAVNPRLARVQQSPLFAVQVRR